MILSLYETNVRDIVNDASALFYSKALVDRCINRARSHTAKRAQCIRVLTPGSSSISSFTQVAAGTGYTTPPTVTISGPDMVQGPTFVQATGTAVLSGNTVASITVTNAGTGYVKPPTVTLSGGGGTGASFTAVLGTHYTTTAGVEVYGFAGAATALATTGVLNVIDILNLAVAYSGTKPILYQSDWPNFQAYFRSYATATQYPAIWAKYAQGESGSYYLAPVPSDQYAIEADCICTPIDLVDDTTVDLIPPAWQEAVFYKAAQYLYENAQRRDDASAMDAIHRSKMGEARENTTSLLVPSYYPTGD